MNVLEVSKSNGNMKNIDINFLQIEKNKNVHKLLLQQ